ncbi:MAG: hypothetical protein FWC90_06985 [Oscillospiraceae bacterium]|nr:hypothetical protein [Oscillospiraceae bacterium]
MKRNTKLLLIKLLHTAIWCVMAAAVFYILYAGIFDRVNRLVWFCIGLVFVEAIILLIFKWRCPLTVLGRKYTDNPSVGFDIFLPVWLANHNKLIFSILFAAGLVLVLWCVL